jgi:DNA (cytosine-5)-methyltransferase 1
MRMLDLFSGYGGFTLAADKQNIETVAFCEKDKYASATLAHNWKGIPNHGDITKTCFKKHEGSIDIITGGSPCQSFSIAGKRTGLDGASGIIDHYFRSIEEVQPTYFIWENVKGVLSIDGGWTFRNILHKMGEIGYDIWWHIFNATDFGVPQNRERVFVVGVRRGSGGEIIFKPEGGRQDTSVDALSINTLNNPSHSNNRVFSPEGIAPTLNTMQGGNRQPKVVIPDVLKESVGIYKGNNVRRLTVLECERLMGIPDNHTKYGVMGGEIVELSNSQRYKMCGNGVVPAKVEYIMSMLKRVSDG